VALSRFLDCAGETTAERVLSILSLVAAVVSIGSYLPDLDPLLFKVAWAIAFASIMGWNVLVLLRDRRTGPPSN